MRNKNNFESEVTDLPCHLGEGKTGLWHIEALRMTRSSPCLVEPALSMIRNRKQTLEICGEIPSPQTILETAWDHALLFIKGCRFLHWNKHISWYLHQYISGFFKLQH